GSAHGCLDMFSTHFGHDPELPTFLRNVGSNFLLKGNALQWQAKKGLRVLAHGGPFADWWSLGDKIITDFREHWSASA
ncbi:MAG: hypothetical protein AAB489_05660, partial [Patescibacteria group bacterium]